MSPVNACGLVLFFFQSHGSVDLATCPLQRISVNNVVKIGASVCVDYDVFKSPSLLVNAGRCFVNACPSGHKYCQREDAMVYGVVAVLFEQQTLRPSGW